MVLSSNSSPNSFTASPQDALLITPIRTDGLNAYFYFSNSDGPHRALILLGGSEGGNSWSNHTEYIKQFVKLGYAVLSMAYFGADGLPPYLRAIPVESITKAFGWLSHQKDVLSEVSFPAEGRAAELAAGVQFTRVCYNASNSNR